MKFREKRNYGPPGFAHTPLSALLSVCEPNQYIYSGKLEEIEQRSKNAVDRLAQLVQILYDKGIFNDDDVLRMLHPRWEKAPEEEG